MTNEVKTIINPQLDYGIFTLARVKNNSPCNGNAITVHKLISLNNDTINDVLTINGRKNCPNNKIAIYNRWDVKPYETKSYYTNGNIFDGYSQSRATLNNSEKLPFGTYFYFLGISNSDSGLTNKLLGVISIK